MKTSNLINKWSEKDKSFLADNYLKLSLPELAISLNRSIKSIRQKIKHINLPQKRGAWAPWLKEQDDLLVELYKQYKSVKEISIILNKSESAIRLRANRKFNCYRNDRLLKEDFKSENFYLALKSTITRKSAGAKCCICEYSKHIELHHIDGNRNNNSISNIASLCPNCHTEVEHKEHLDKMLFCFWWRLGKNQKVLFEKDNKKEIMANV